MNTYSEHQVKPAQGGGGFTRRRLTDQLSCTCRSSSTRTRPPTRSDCRARTSWTTWSATSTTRSRASSTTPSTRKRLPAARQADVHAFSRQPSGVDFGGKAGHLQPLMSAVCTRLVSVSRPTSAPTDHSGQLGELLPGTTIYLGARRFWLLSVELLGARWFCSDRCRCVRGTRNSCHPTMAIVQIKRD